MPDLSGRGTPHCHCERSEAIPAGGRDCFAKTRRGRGCFAMTKGAWLKRLLRRPDGSGLLAKTRSMCRCERSEAILVCSCLIYQAPRDGWRLTSHWGLLPESREPRLESLGSLGQPLCQPAALCQPNCRLTAYSLYSTFRDVSTASTADLLNSMFL